MKGIKKLLGLGLALTLSLGMVACSSSGKDKEEVGDKLQQIKDSGKLVLATSADYSPYEFHAMVDGKDTIVGFDVSIAKAIADEIGVELEVMDMDFDGLLGALNADKADIVLACMTPDEERVKNADFSELYYEDKNVVIVRKIPAALEGCSIDGLVVEIAEILQNKSKVDLTDLSEISLHRMACKRAVKGNAPLSFKEMEDLVQNVYTLGNINTCPHGRPIEIKMSKKDLEKEFKRIV